MSDDAQDPATLEAHLAAIYVAGAKPTTGPIVLKIREPEWFQHRVLKGPDTDVNLHVFSEGCEEVERMLRFRDHLRANDADRALYEDTKRELAKKEWPYVQAYADAKGAVVREIMLRAAPR